MRAIGIDKRRFRMSYLDEGRGTTLVLVHPFPLSAEAWVEDAAALAPRMRVVAPSMRGFGGTMPFDMTPSIDEMADDAASLLDGLGIHEPVVFGGLSMGGYVALAFARRHRHRLRALVLADTRPDADAPPVREAREKAILRIEGGELEAYVDELLTKLLSKSTHATRPERVAAVRKLAMTAPPGSVIEALEALRDRPDARAELARLDVPALVLVGAEDEVTPPAVATAMAQALPCATLRVIPGAGHLSNLEAPDAFRSAVEAFVTGLDRS